MSSIELSDEIDSSDDEDHIIAKMETKSGLPQKTSIQTFNRADNTMLKSETALATVKMSGGVLKSGRDLYNSSESEDEDIMKEKEVRQPVLRHENSTSYSSVKTDPKIFRASPSAIKTNTPSPELNDITINGKNSPNFSEIDTADISRKTVINSSAVIENGDRLSKEYKDSRFNPFDRDLHVDEDHFEEKPLSHQLMTDKINRIKSGKFSRLPIDPFSDKSVQKLWFQKLSSSDN